MKILEEILGSRTRAELFRLLFESPDRELYLRELQRQSGVSMRPIQEELNKLLRTGLVKTRKDGNRLYFSANSEHPLFPEIRHLVEKTVGFHGLLRAALADSDIKNAFIFGSVASGTARPNSDLDLFVIGNLGLRKLSALLSGLSDRIGRVINPHVLTEDEYRRKIRAKEHFITSVMDTPKIFIIGDEDELKRMGKK
jgi:predicted nucleotidyltransferase